jgi:hypothetical protein
MKHPVFQCDNIDLAKPAVGIAVDNIKAGRTKVAAGFLLGYCSFGTTHVGLPFNLTLSVKSVHLAHFFTAYPLLRLMSGSRKRLVNVTQNVLPE